MSHSSHRLALSMIVGVLLASACTVKKQETPPLTGPSELSTSISISLSSDVLFQDGASQSLVTITARDHNGQPIRNLPLRVEIAVDGFITDFGTLSARSVVTDANGRATVTYTAPPAPGVSIDTGTIVQIRVTPLGNDFGNATPRFATIRLTPTGVINPPTTGLTPRFVATPATPTDHQTVIFDASASTTTSGSIVSYRWDFGDGDTASGITAQHAFDEPGTFIVTLTVTDSIGRVNKTSQAINVSQGTLPVATIVFSPSSPSVNQAVNFNGSTSKPGPGRTIVSYEWSFGDGTFGSGAQIAKAYSRAGDYKVVLTVTDDAGRVATSTETVTITP